MFEPQIDVQAEDSQIQYQNLLQFSQPMGQQKQKLNFSKNKFICFLQQNSATISNNIPADIIGFINGKGEKALSNLNFTLKGIITFTKIRVGKMIKNKRMKKNWGASDLKMLIWIVSNYTYIHNKKHTELGESDWEEISSIIPGTEPETLMFKWLSLRKNNLSEVHWKSHQDQILKAVVVQSEKAMDGCINWIEISKSLYRLNSDPQRVYREPKQCREHWNCYLNPEIKKGPWSIQQDVLLMNLVYKSGGNKKWTVYVKNFGGRTQNALKNRFNLLLDRQRKNIEEESGKVNYNEKQILLSFLAKFGIPIHERDDDKQSHQQYQQEVPSQITSSIKKKLVKKRKKKEDEDWFTNYRNKNFNACKKFQNVSTPTIKRSIQLRNKQSEANTSEKKESTIDDQAINLNNSQQPFNFSIKIDQDNLSENKDDSIPISDIKIVEINNDEIQRMKMSEFLYIPCELLQDRLKFYGQREVLQQYLD